MPITGISSKQLNEKECFDLWIDLGSLNKVSKRLEKEGKINVVTERPFTTAGIRFAALRHLIYNPITAKERIRESDPNAAIVQKDVIWKRFLAERAHDVLVNSAPEKIYKWAEDYDVPKEFVDNALF